MVENYTDLQNSYKKTFLENLNLFHVFQKIIITQILCKKKTDRYSDTKKDILNWIYYY